ncbi:helix-turn-helix domain-containing protein [Streptomyces sp. NPDC051658]|uniref:helix-turn-helix domain-containing protein n=1 Tax=unclassified Streptomyces TaxID=2593676 RepID=UPI00379256A2|nr:helix-turn-helix domain-containing protein [Streptomyces sp. NBC_00984]
MLQALGLGPAEEAIYTALLARPTASAQDLARQTGLEKAESVRILLDLAARGLVALATEAESGAPDSADCEAGLQPAHYRLTPPSVALAPLLVEQRNALHQAETAFSMLTEQYRTTAAHTAGGVVEVVVGVEQVAHRFHQLQCGAQRELLVFLVGTPIAVPREDTDTSESSALDRGVDFRVIAAKNYLHGHDVVRDVRAAVMAGLELRMVDSLPLKMVVSDRERAMVPLDMADSGGEPSAIVVHRSGLLTALVHLFEKEWAQARPMYTTPTGVRAEPAADQQPTEEELEVLALLLAGISDRRAASQLGLSIRTVERRIRRLMDLAGAESRLQLGWHAALTGWL